MALAKIKTLLIDDSGFMRIFLSDILRSDDRIEVVATARNGLEGVEKVKALRPDVVVTDMVMPQYDGLYVVRELMKEVRVPIILVSSLTRADPQIFDALLEGAFDFVDKPQEKDIEEGCKRLRSMIREASMTDYLKLHHRTRARNSFAHTFESRLNYDVITIGASTGGPGAVEFLIQNLPANLTIPVVIAQHMPDRFIESFSTRLKGGTGLNVSVMQEGEILLPNHIYLAPGTSNLRIHRSGQGAVAVYTNDHYSQYNNPSIDCLFESIARTYGERTMGIVLTGMGKDGTKGLKKIKEAGGFTLAQDEASSVVYGMPRSAFESGAASYKIALHEIPGFIISAL